MPPTITYRFGDVVLVPFPFTDQTGSKKRPAIVVSSLTYHQRRRDLIIMAVTSQIRPAAAFGEVTLTEWQKAGLLQPSVTKPILATLERPLILRRLGQLQDVDRKALQYALGLILG
jgi:mRNA interferase MazF